MHIFHDWLPWARPIATYNTGHKAQWRVCKTCGKAQVRTLRWDKQCNVIDVNRSLDAVALAAKGE